MPITVTATGEVVHSYNTSSLFPDLDADPIPPGTVIVPLYDEILGAKVTATWVYDSDYAGTNQDPSGTSQALYAPRTNWISSTISIEVGSNEWYYDLGELLIDEDANYQDDLSLSDREQGASLDSYSIRNAGSNSRLDWHVYSTALIECSIGELISSLDAAQTLSWLADDSAGDYGEGYFSFQGSAIGDTAEVVYSLNSLVVTAGSASVPEPSIYLLLGLGLTGLGLRRLKKGS